MSTTRNAKILDKLRKQLPHARFTITGGVEITYDLGVTWEPAPHGSIDLNPLPLEQAKLLSR